MLLKNGKQLVVIESAGGVYNTEQLQAISNFSNEELGFIKVTETQRIACMVENGQALEKALLKANLTLKPYCSDKSLTPKGIKPCLGALCAQFKQDAFAHAVTLGQKLPELSDNLSISINGCSRGCVPSITDDVHCVGEENGYRVFLGGSSQNGEFKLGKSMDALVDADNLVTVLGEIWQEFLQKKAPNENFTQFRERIGVDGYALEKTTERNNAMATNGDSLEELIAKQITEEKPEVEKKSEEFSEASEEDMSKILGSLQESYTDTGGTEQAAPNNPAEENHSPGMEALLPNSEYGISPDSSKATVFASESKPFSLTITEENMTLTSTSMVFCFPLASLPRELKLDIENERFIFSKENDGSLKIKAGPLKIELGNIPLKAA